jgi:hypothetical protein
MTPSSKTVAVFVTVLALSLILPSGSLSQTPTFGTGPNTPPDSTSISTAIFFTDQNLNSLPLDARGNPMVKANIAVSTACSSYNNKHNCLATRTSSTVGSTTPSQLIVWINITRTSAVPLQSLRLNETIPQDWAVNPPWTTAAGTAIHLYYANTAQISTDPDITQFSTITFLTGTPNVLRLAIPNFNTTAIGHPLLASQSILLSVKLTYTPVGAAHSSVTYPKNYTDAASTSAWTQKSYTGIESTRSASAFFATYAIYPTPESASPRPLLDSILSLLPIVGFVVAVVAMGYGMMALSNRKRRSRGSPTSTPQQ